MGGGDEKSGCETARTDLVFCSKVVYKCYFSYMSLSENSPPVLTGGESESSCRDMPHLLHQAFGSPSSWVCRLRSLKIKSRKEGK